MFKERFKSAISPCQTGGFESPQSIISNILNNVGLNKELVIEGSDKHYITEQILKTQRLT